MSRLDQLRALGVTTALALCAIAPAAHAADHRDGAAVKMDPSTDINDLYAWMSRDGAKINLAMTVFPLAETTARFSDTAKYVFHVSSGQTFGATTTTAMSVVCTFDAGTTQPAGTQRMSCWVMRGNDVIDYLTGDASRATGLTSTSGRIQAFAGLRDDPFFFNLVGFQATVAMVAAARSSLTLDAAGCPSLDMATSAALVTQLQSGVGGGAATNFFTRANTLAIVLSIDKALLTPGGSILAIWASTNK